MLKFEKKRKEQFSVKKETKNQSKNKKQKKQQKETPGNTRKRKRELFSSHAITPVPVSRYKLTN